MLKWQKDNYQIMRGNIDEIYKGRIILSIKCNKPWQFWWIDKAFPVSDTGGVQPHQSQYDLNLHIPQLRTA